MAHGRSGPKYALDKVWDRSPRTPHPGIKIPVPDFEEPLIGVGEVEPISLQKLQQDQELLRRVVELLPLDEVRAAVQGYARQSEVLTEALGGRELVSAVLGELDGALSREESALLRSDLEHELGGPLDDSSEAGWSEREAEHARWGLTRFWVSLALAAVRQQNGPVPLDATLCPSPPSGRPKGDGGWDASPEDAKEALLASVAVKPEGLDALLRAFHGKVADAVVQRGPLELPGRVELAQERGALVARPYR